MNRRQWLSGSAACIATRGLTSIGVAADRHSEPAPCVMAADFVGLSYESTQLYNPSFFCGRNAALIATFRALTPSGVLRLGGNLSDYSRWRSETGDSAPPQAEAAIEHGKSYWEWKLTDQTVRRNRDGAITPAGLRNLKTFPDATGWKAIYGLNFGSGSIARAKDEAAHASRILGDRLLALQLGNEVDFYGGNRYFRNPDYSFDTYLAEFRAFAAAVNEAAPGAPIAGPDTAVNMEWVRRLHEALGPKLAFLSSHYYAMGPASDPAMTAERLLSSAPRLKEQQAAFEDLSKSGGVSFRVTEANSCFGGGKPGVSDGPVSALLSADYLLQTAPCGYAGVNIHGGGDGLYTPIETVTETVIKRPLYYGLQFANLFAGCAVIETALSDGLTAYSGRRRDRTVVALFNKSDRDLPAAAPDHPLLRPRRTLLLQTTGPVSLVPIRDIPQKIAPGSAVAAIW